MLTVLFSLLLLAVGSAQGGKLRRGIIDQEAEIQGHGSGTHFSSALGNPDEAEIIVGSRFQDEMPIAPTGDGPTGHVGSEGIDLGGNYEGSQVFNSVAYEAPSHFEGAYDVGQVGNVYDGSHQGGDSFVGSQPADAEGGFNGWKPLVAGGGHDVGVQEGNGGSYEESGGDYETRHAVVSSEGYAGGQAVGDAGVFENVHLSGGGYGGQPLENLQTRHQIQIEKHVHVPVVKNIEVPVPHPVPVAVPEPVPVQVPVPFPVQVPVPVHVENTVPVPVEKPVPYPVERPYPVHVVKKLPVPVPHHYPVPVPVYKTKYIIHIKYHGAGIAHH